MNEIIVLGGGCKKCHQTEDLIAETLKEKGLDVPLSLDTNPQSVMKYKVMRTPAVVIDGKVVHFGSVPTAEVVQSWFE